MISGWPIHLYSDADGDGALDPDEIASKQSTTTNASGLYQFPNLGTGKYIACEASADRRRLVPVRTARRRRRHRHL